ncbi:plasmid partitioning protein RepB C-terminal domain-containing protein [Asticcacaulis sp.]|uniref:plasmid partitioning protein RepB C-terminal domain-containing protein n=1 Tax=Asticcacaulis sp. TaxID=1872648 RepID=UPI003F7CB34E
MYDDESKGGAIRSGFEDVLIPVRLEQIVFLKAISAATRRSAKYQQIRASIEEIGIIEPPVVHADSKLKGKFILLDGHLRVDILQGLNEPEVMCLLSRDDEAFTYNKHINRVATIQEHRMILRAIERGVSEERLAAALNVDLRNIQLKRNLLIGICSEAVELLKDKVIAPKTFKPLKAMKPVRQVEVARLMSDSEVYTHSYALALLAATPQDLLVHPQKPKRIKGLDTEKMARMEAEMEGLQKDFQLIEDSYAVDVMTLTFAKGYLSALLGNARVVKYMAANQLDILKEFERITETTSLSAMQGDNSV